jgi:hypothetical protein
MLLSSKAVGYLLLQEPYFCAYIKNSIPSVGTTTFLRICVISNVYYKPAEILDGIAMQEGSNV